MGPSIGGLVAPFPDARPPLATQATRRPLRASPLHHDGAGREDLGLHRRRARAHATRALAQALVRAAQRELRPRLAAPEKCVGLLPDPLSWFSGWISTVAPPVESVTAFSFRVADPEAEREGASSEILYLNR